MACYGFCCGLIREFIVKKNVIGLEVTFLK